MVSGTYYGKITCSLTQLSLVYALGESVRSLGDKPLVILHFPLVPRLVIIAWKDCSKFRKNRSRACALARSFWSLLQSFHAYRDLT